MTINAKIDKRIRTYLLSRLPEDNRLTPHEAFSVSVWSIVNAMPDVRAQDVLEQIRKLYVAGSWFSTDHGEPTPEENVTLYSVLRPTKGWTIDQLRQALEKPPLLSEREDKRGHGPKLERW